MGGRHAKKRKKENEGIFLFGVSSVERYAPGTNAWRRCGADGDCRNCHAVAVLEGKLSKAINTLCGRLQRQNGHLTLPHLGARRESFVCHLAEGVWCSILATLEFP